jgi:outer membrane protein TolC
MKPNKLIIGVALTGACGLLLAFPAKAQNTLEAYIDQGLKSNQSIQQQNFILEKNMYALKEAKSMFLPDVSFGTTYTKTHGGRTIDVPLGDLLNNAYTTLNKLTGSSAFPQVQNQHILINPDNFYDSRFRTTLPILNAELIYNKRIKGQQVDLQKEEVLLYKRELVKDIKTAYYQYLKAVNAVDIYTSSLALVQEGLRVNTALQKNDKVNRTAVLRSDNEVARINASLTTSRQTRESAKNYFNFLLNRPLTDSIMIDESFAQPPTENYSDQGVEKREELSKLKLAGDINANLTGLAKSYLVPKIGTSIDLGSQAFDWKFNSSSRYYLFGVSLEWSLFSFGRHSYQIKQAIADQHSIAAQTDYVKLQLQTELSVRKNGLVSSMAQYRAALTEMHTAQTYYGDELKLYKEGLAIYIELLDAQNQLIDTRLQTNISLYDTWIANAEIERATAGFSIK